MQRPRCRDQPRHLRNSFSRWVWNRRRVCSLSPFLAVVSWPHREGLQVSERKRKFWRRPRPSTWPTPGEEAPTLPPAVLPHLLRLLLRVPPSVCRRHRPPEETRFRVEENKRCNVIGQPHDDLDQDLQWWEKVFGHLMHLWCAGLREKESASKRRHPQLAKKTKNGTIANHHCTTKILEVSLLFFCQKKPSWKRSQLRSTGGEREDNMYSRRGVRTRFGCLSSFCWLRWTSGGCWWTGPWAWSCLLKGNQPAVCL